MRGRTPRWFVVATLALGTAGLLAPISVSAGTTTTHSIQDFIAVQGTHCFADETGNCVLFAPPAPNYVFWGNDVKDRLAAVDYAGLEAAYLAVHGGPSLGTTFSGTVSQQPLADGREKAVSCSTRITPQAAWCAFPMPTRSLATRSRRSWLGPIRPWVTP
jgi:hypothetical protein